MHSTRTLSHNDINNIYLVKYKGLKQQQTPLPGTFYEWLR